MATQPGVAGKLRFGGFELDARAGELRKHGVRLRLRGQPLLVLEILLGHAGDVVTREELQTRIWPADTLVDFDHGLHNAIARIREVLGDSAEAPRYIETLPRRGYRYIGPVPYFQVLRPATEIGENKSQPAAPVPRAHRKRSLVLALCAVFALGLVALTVGQAVRAKGAASPIRSIAVLPIDNLSGEPSEEFFADGMTDQLITDLAKIDSLRVISRTSVMQYRGAKKGVPEIARELKVDAIIEGSVIRAGQRVRVTAQLIQAPVDRHLWAETYDRDLGDILKLQGEVADAIAGQVRAQLTPTQHASLRRAHAVKPDAYDSYLKGRLYFTNEYANPDSLRKAQHYFDESIQEDPNFALAYAGLADAYAYLAFAGAMPRDQAYRSAKEALAKGLQLDDTIGEAYYTLGILSWRFDWDLEAADRQFDRAVALAPSYSCAREVRAGFLATIGRRAEALADLANVDQLDYGFGAGQSQSYTYYVLQDYPNLIESGRRGLLLDPNDWYQHFMLGAGYEGTGKLQEAASEYQKAFAISGNPQSAVALAHAYSASGKRAEAEKILHDLERKLKRTSPSAYTMATIYAGLGENDKALGFLEKAFSEKSFDIPSPPDRDLVLDSLRGEPRFQLLVHRMDGNNLAFAGQAAQRDRL
ncbi:MAG TPA: winged helix-turn-helix domain-containing protein [Bryobacteraceae bacterium]|nr:winged helix-turn-helix domain-containing protein [Bryobacteraceae bacterium]